MYLFIRKRKRIREAPEIRVAIVCPKICWQKKGAIIPKKEIRRRKDMVCSVFYGLQLAVKSEIRDLYCFSSS
jgi:hypothetical protein